MSKLVLAPDLRVPIDTLTETLAVLGIRGSGKTNTAVVLAEELLARQQQVVVIDPTDVWWGLKSSKDGNGPGYPVIVLGGRKAELPLGADDGKTIADVIVDHGASLILALRHFESKGDMRRFITDFAERLYYRKGQLDTPTPLMLIIDEASLVVPQNVMGENARMVGAIQQLVRQGRSSGIGVTLIDQRAASVNKDVLTQLEVLICHRTTSPQDRKALKEWVQQHDEHDRGGAFLDSLASLPKGDAWFWAPGLLDLFVRVHVRERRTFDSSRTPKAGERIEAPKVFAPVDLDALRGQLAQTIEQAKADDPKELQKRIRDLEREVRAAENEVRVSGPSDAEVERMVQHAIAAEGARHERYRRVLISEIEQARHDLEQIANLMPHLAAAATAALGRIDSAVAIEVEDGGWVKPMRAPDPAPTYHAKLDGPVEKTRTDHRTGVTTRSQTPANSQLRILQACVQLEAIGIPKPTLVQVALMVGVSHTTGSYQPNVRELVGDGYLLRESGRVSLIDTGRAAAGDVEIPTKAKLHDFWYNKLPAPQAKILRELIRWYPKTQTMEQLARSVGVSPTTGSFQQNVRELATYGLASREKGVVNATELLFPRGLR